MVTTFAFTAAATATAKLLAAAKALIAAGTVLSATQQLADYFKDRKKKAEIMKGKKL